MKPPFPFNPLEMWVGGIFCALLGLIVVPLPWPEEFSAVGLFCLVGTLLGWAVARAREAWRPVLPPGRDATELVGQKSFLLNTFSEAKVAFRETSVHAVAAGRYLDAADKDFADGAFAPFWDQIERAANELAAYKNAVEQMGRCVHVYQSEALELENTPDAVPPLQLSDHQLPDARPLVDRFTTLVRRAQTNFQFAMIYEQRKTNQLLHAGFGTLGAAIYSLGESVNLSLANLSKTMNRRLDALVATTFVESDFQHELKQRRHESTTALDRTLRGRLDG
ncbi:MAG: hypothetical protein ABSH19_06675 [Opitutales bacterium]|jgi:hypothetical protein